MAEEGSDIQKASIIQADEYGNYEKIKNFDKELEFVSFVLSQIDEHNPKIVTYHYNFISLLIKKALRYNLSGYGLFEKDNMMLGKTKWENYLSRYSDHYHINLFDVINNYIGVNGATIDELSKELQLPIIDNSSENSCEFKAYTIYIIYLKFEILRGNILESDYRYILDGVMSQNFHEDLDPIVEFIANEQS